jgi:hypothetical protein
MAGKAGFENGGKRAFESGHWQEGRGDRRQADIEESPPRRSRSRILFAVIASDIVAAEAAARMDANVMPRIVLVLPLFLPLLAAGQARAQDINSQLAHCMTMSGAVERLSCYDRVARQAVGAAPQSPSAQAPQTQAPLARVEPPADPSRGFGQEQLRKSPAAEQAEQAERMTAEIVDYQKDARDHFTVVLQNGQVWRQMAGDTGIAQFRSGRTHQVTISRGVLGSYDLRFNDRNLSFKVQRLR